MCNIRVRGLKFIRIVVEDLDEKKQIFDFERLKNEAEKVVSAKGTIELSLAQELQKFIKFIILIN